MQDTELDYTATQESKGQISFGLQWFPLSQVKCLLLWRVCIPRTSVQLILCYSYSRFSHQPDQQPVTEAPPTCLRASEHATPTTLHPWASWLHSSLATFGEGAGAPPSSPMAQPSSWCLPLPCQRSSCIIFDPVQHADPMNEWMSNQRCFREGVTMSRTQMVRMEDQSRRHDYS